MTTFTVQTAAIRACLHIAPKKDIRYQLIGVHFNTGKGVLEATDGRAAIRIKAPGLISPVASFIIPRAALETALKFKSTDMVIDTEQGTITAGGGSVTFAPVDCAFPDVSRVVPQEFDPTAKAANVDHSLLYRIASAFRELGMDKHAALRVVAPKGGTYNAHLILPENALETPVYAVVMPRRTDADTATAAPF